MTEFTCGAGGKLKYLTSACPHLGKHQGQAKILYFLSHYKTRCKAMIDVIRR